MKIRIKGNSIRLRLSRSEVNTFGKTGHVVETVQFPGQLFIYRLQRVGESAELHASMHDNTITVMMPDEMADEWINSETVGYHSDMCIGNTCRLSILVEKDFQCLDETVEDQSDNFENPNKTC